MNNFWKVPKKYLKNIEQVRGNKICNKVVKLKIKKNGLIPKWAKNKSPLYIREYNNKKTKGDVYFDDVCMLEIADKIYINNFDGVISDLLYERYLDIKAPLFTKLPFPYHHIPLSVRNFLFNTLIKLKKDPLYPRWPIDSSVDLLRFLFLNSLKYYYKKPIPYIGFWPNKKFALVVAHDIETNFGYKNIDDFREIEKKYGIKSSWNIVAKRGKIDFNKLRRLKKEGCEIGSQGYNHDGKLPYLNEKKIRKRINFCLSKLKEFNVKGFRSPQLQRNERLLKILSNYFYYDSSVPDTELYSPIAVRNGTTTVFPFFVEKMVELPLTMPQDFYMKYIYKLDKNKVFEIWKNKIDYIREVGGLASFNIHPDSYISGNDEYLNLYEKILKYISKFEDCWKSTPIEVAEWWNERDRSYIKDTRIKGSKRAKIILS